MTALTILALLCVSFVAAVLIVGLIVALLTGGDDAMGDDQ